MRITLRPRGFAVPVVLAGLVLALSIPLRGGPTEVTFTRESDEVLELADEQCRLPRVDT
jgi:hypothetical protein